jgi:hypothetical protein
LEIRGVAPFAAPSQTGSMRMCQRSRVTHWILRETRRTAIGGAYGSTRAE